MSLFRRNIKHMQRLMEPLPPPIARKPFGVLSYNILSSSGELELADATYVWKRRRKNVVKTILGFNADIICLQEVDADVSDWMNQQLRPKTYQSVYARNMALESKDNGVCLMWNKNRFSCIHHDVQYTVRHHMFVVVILRDAFTQEHVCVVNVRLTPGDDIMEHARVLEMKQVLSHIMCSQHIDTETTPIIVAGYTGSDVNSWGHFRNPDSLAHFMQSTDDQFLARPFRAVFDDLHSKSLLPVLTECNLSPSGRQHSQRTSSMWISSPPTSSALEHTIEMVQESRVIGPLSCDYALKKRRKKLASTHAPLFAKFRSLNTLLY